MKTIIVLLLLCLSTIGYAQKPKDIFNTNSTDERISWLGVDFSHVKLIGEFSEFNGIGYKSPSQIKDHYFMAWNRLILNEREKYDIKGMLGKSKIYYDVDMIFQQNEKASLEDMESYNNPEYTEEDITKFVNMYNLEGKAGIGVVFIAESLNKAETLAYFHFVAINMSDKKVLLHKRLQAEPGGIGLRNYWAGAIYDAMKQVEETLY